MDPKTSSCHSQYSRIYTFSTEVLMQTNPSLPTAYLKERQESYAENGEGHGVSGAASCAPCWTVFSTAHFIFCFFFLLFFKLPGFPPSFDNPNWKGQNPHPHSVAQTNFNVTVLLLHPSYYCRNLRHLTPHFSVKEPGSKKR